MNTIKPYFCTAFRCAAYKTILGLLDSGEITQAYLADAWLDF
ncbi:MAG: hypothetical protein PUK54_07460 [Firmicutes bacterium]|nr:hypothetical protein [Bacillota bacterium]MDY5856133.1 hypothetical protein [Anaerovoracaceae bacterium]